MHIQPSGELAFLILVTGVIALAAFFFYDINKEKHDKKSKP